MDIDAPPFPEGVWDVWVAFGLSNIEDWLMVNCEAGLSRSRAVNSQDQPDP